MPAARDIQITRHYQRLQRSDGLAVIYHVGGVGQGARVALNAEGGELIGIRARSEFETADNEGFLTDLESRDYIFNADDLRDDAEALIMPDIGDVIEERRSETVSRFFQVFTPGNGRPAWRWSDPDRTWLRIHSKFIEEAEPTEASP